MGSKSSGYLKKSKYRIDWMDWAKAIAIFIVVFGHIGTPAMQYIFSFHMPFFILLSGFLQKKRSPLEELKRSSWSLLLPYVIYNVILLVYSLFTGEYNAQYPIMMLTGRQWFLSMACRPMWFLLALFWMRIAYSICGKRWSYVLAAACIVLLIIGKNQGWLMPEKDWFEIWPAIICFPFYMLGILMHDVFSKVADREMSRAESETGDNKIGIQMGVVKERWGIKVVMAIIGAAAFAAGMWIATYNGFVNIFRCSPGDNILLFYMSGCLMAAGLTLVIMNLLDFHSSYIQLISEGTLLIFATHQAILWPLHNIFKGITIPEAVAVALLTVVMLSAFAWAARRWCPVFLGKKSVSK